jgi:phosphoribosyl 1,2-cyclic phosphate phosphodiesterase
LNLTFLGTGTSVGIPVIGCECAVCRSEDPRNIRLRSSLYVVVDGLHLVIDTSPDFRQQALRHRIPRVDAVLVTHSHADHIFGLDEVRRYNTLQNAVIPVYAADETVADLKRIFNYIYVEAPPGTYRPRLDMISVEEPFQVGDGVVTPIPVIHGHVKTLGFRLDAGGHSIGYVPDCREMPDRSLALLKDVDVMVLDALRHRPHATHLTVEESVALLRKIGARRSLLTHLCHDLDHAETQAGLPPGIEVSWDGLEIKVG